MTDKRYPFWKAAPHVFILGAGASRAAFPDGDKIGRKLPLMSDFIKILGLEDILKSYGVDYSNQNIEEIYDGIHQDDPDNPVLQVINDRIVSYFSVLQIPDEVTLYDQLILSLQKKDAIFSFNWDPLLLQVYQRNIKLKELPTLCFLHSNVYIGVCKKDKRNGYFGNKCSKCNEYFEPSPLLYPIRKKNYQDEFIANEWKALKWYLKRAFILTIFGYSAPTTDIEARDAILNSWKNNDRRELNETKIINTGYKTNIENIWSDFIYKSHDGIYKNARHTRSFLYARRSCESWGDAILQNYPWKENKMPQFRKLDKLQKWVRPLIDEEVVFKENDILIPPNR